MNVFTYDDFHLHRTHAQWTQDLQKQIENRSHRSYMIDDCGIDVSASVDIEDSEDYDCDQEENLESEYDDEECGQCYGRMDDLGLSWRDFC